ncbi:MAG: MATE family efflux transporter [Flavobacterium sp.]|nr:MATE family efflux transporter [Flavobacterium sp.]
MHEITTHIKQTIKLALPIAIGQLGHIMMGVVDSLMVGHLGSAQLAAASLVNGLFFLIIVLGIGMSMAITPLVAIAAGAHDKEEIKNIFNNGFWVNMVFAVILIGVTFGASYAIPYLKQPKEVSNFAISFLQILTISIAPFLIFQVFRQYLDGLSIVKPSMVIAILANFINAFFNWVLIYGKFGLPALGLNGSALATTISRFFMAGAICVYLYKINKNKELTPFISIRKYDINLIKKIVQIGLPAGFQYFLEIAAFSFSAIMIGWFGSRSLAAHQIALNLASITYMVILGISSAGTIRVGNFMGAKDMANVRKAGFTAIGISGSIMLASALIFILTNKIIPGYYITDPGVIEIASKLIIIAAFFQLADGLQASAVGVLRGLTDVKVPLMITFASYWIVAIPTGYLLGVHFNMGAVGIWIGLSVGLFLVAISCLIRFSIKSRK